MHKVYTMTIGCLICAVLVGCGSESPKPAIIYQSLKDVPETAWKTMANQSFFFAHQSVGNNILDGIRDLKKEHPKIPISIEELEVPASVPAGVLAHARIGQNLDPVFKIDEFKRWMDNGLGNRVDVAFLKLCYLDIKNDTDVPKLFDHYRAVMADLQTRYPRTRFIHFTEPLTVSKTTWKTRLKKMLGKTDLWEYNDNIKRNEFNLLMREAYGKEDLLFDIAGLQSLAPDGSFKTFSLEGKTYQSMVPAYTKDGGHLNEQGRRHVAEALVALLASL